ncbi:hypothetical protein OIU84_010582 [Salix udensis]|uniref:Uncharacterized protein n=1 Tax=Salix udensis TaxID=889485 RepID=A0AAD6NVP6_9ROSI|nr:hypothetical protein OIU84_010582 [Salix udensis]
MEAEDKDGGEFTIDGNYNEDPTAISLSLQFPLLVSNECDNQLATKAKDSLEEKKGSESFIQKMKRLRLLARWQVEV